MPALLCLCACPDEDTAARIADVLVGERLAACVNVLPGMRSVYRWQDAVESAREVLLLAKTTAARQSEVTARIAGIHPYEVPEVIALRIDSGLPAYLDWIARETAPDPAPAGEA